MSENRRSRNEKPAKKPKRFVWLALPAALLVLGGGYYGYTVYQDRQEEAAAKKASLPLSTLWPIRSTVTCLPSCLKTV